MSHSRKRRWTLLDNVNRHNQNNVRARRRAFRRLFAETLERRILLATITSVNPPANSHDALVSTDIAATFDQDDAKSRRSVASGWRSHRR